MHALNEMRILSTNPFSLPNILMVNYCTRTNMTTAVENIGEADRIAIFRPKYITYDQLWASRCCSNLIERLQKLEKIVGKSKNLTDFGFSQLSGNYCIAYFIPSSTQVRIRF